MKKRLLIFLLISTLILYGCSNSKYSKEKLDNFAKCLTEEGVKMYGAFWCPHCRDQKKMFGSSFQYINYVECDPKGKNSQTQLCLEKGIKGYPTWELKDSIKYSGVMPLEMLEEKSGCSLK